MRSLMIAALALGLAGCGTVKDYHKDGTPEAFAGLVTVSGDALDGYRVASSDPVRMPYRELMGIDSDIFFRAFAYEDGKARVQFYVWTQADDWLFPYALNFGSPLRSIKVDRVDSDVHCASTYCNHREDVVAILSDDDVRYLLSDACPEVIDLRLKTKGTDVDRTIRKAELVATLDAVGLTDRYR